MVAERDARVAEAVSARPTGVRLAEAVVDAVVEQYTDPTSHDPRVLLLLTNCPALREAYLHAAGQIEDPLAAVIADRIGSRDPYTSQVLSASVAVAIRVALHRWLLSEDTSVSGHGLVVPSGSLPELLRISLGVVTPELDAAEKRSP